MGWKTLILMIKTVIKVIVEILLLLGVALAIACLLISRTMIQSAEGRILQDAGKLSGYDGILVLGAGVYPDGSPTPMLAYRVETGIDLQKKGAATLLLMSGDSEKPDYDETGTMVRLARNAGIPETEILQDVYGLCTYDSIWRAKEVYGMKRVVLVTQRYHLYRALYYADRLGVEAAGVPAEDRMDLGQLYREVRELLARVKALIWCQSLPDPAHTEPADK